MESEKYLLYRYNSFFKKITDGTLLRVGSREMIIKEHSIPYEAIVTTIEKLQRPVLVSDMGLLSKEEITIIKFLIKVKVVALSEIEYEKSNTFHYLLRNYDDFNKMQEQLSKVQLEVILPRKEKKQADFIGDIGSAFEEKRKFYLDYSENKEKRFLLLVATSLEDIEEILSSNVYKEYERIILFTTFLKENYITEFKDVEKLKVLLEKILKNEKSEKDDCIDKKLLTFMMNYVFILIMDQCSEHQKFNNSFLINKSLEVKNNSFNGLVFNKEIFSLSIDESLKALPKEDKKYYINEFIKVSKNLLDLKFNYEFSKEDYLNVVTTEVKIQGKQIKAQYKEEALVGAAEGSIKLALKEIFLAYGINVKPLMGTQEVEEYINEVESAGKPVDSIKVFDDMGIFQKTGIILVEV
ncbi:hypothetical protein [Clostridium cellulovorans]|uniref:Uncharacterized protein n=1 Tax=Clostridium cellulovorans (strain ATCC 35296 / DSM 3052 / OCM 3 / 743B) TaxID=573061 RepID=D9SWM1_CLOC7|nr:hypothetical protein [Clostridium cellulovorans]ADL53303.1 hypothetical protein Clocel_3632 [Clostridium cellulovorans 743B]